MALGVLHAVGPIQAVQAVEQAVCVGGDAHHPLAHGLLHDGVSATFGQAVLDFVVGQHRAEGRAPIDFAVREVSDPEGHEDLGAFLLGHAVPVGGRERSVEMGSKMREAQALPPVLVARGVDVEVAVLGKRLDEFSDGARLLGFGVVPALEQLPENPLGPLVIRRVAGADFPGPIEAKSELFQLVAVPGDVLLGGDGGMLAGLDGVLLCRKAKAVVPHRMKDVEALVALVPGVDVGRDVSERVSHVQARTRRVGEHVQHVVLGFGSVFGHLVGV